MKARHDLAVAVLQQACDDMDAVDLPRLLKRIEKLDAKIKDETDPDRRRKMMVHRSGIVTDYNAAASSRDQAIDWVLDKSPKSYWTGSCLFWCQLLAGRVPKPEGMLRGLRHRAQKAPRKTWGYADGR